MNISTIIPVYKKEELFLGNLEHNARYLQKTEVIIVVDDPTSRGLKERIHAIIPQAHVLHNSINMGFSAAMNRAVEKAHAPFLLFLNSDVVLKDTAYTRAVDLLKKNKLLFAVSFAQIEKDGSMVGANTGQFSRGLFEHRGKSTQKPCNNLWPEGGSSLLRTSYFRQLGGYDDLFTPFYWEDVDLGYRAWKRGYRVVFEPTIVVEHHHETTIRSFFSAQRIHHIAQRNQFLFMWKNMDQDNLKKHLHQLLSLLTAHPSLTIPAASALLRLTTVFETRKKEIPLWKKTDEEVLSAVQP